MATLLLQPDATAGKDCHIETPGTTANYGTADPLNVGVLDTGGKIANTYRSLLEFDISTLPIGATITTDSKLTLIVTGHDSGRTGQALSRCTRPGDASGWLEAQATYAEYKTGSAWTTPGGDISLTNTVAFAAPSATGTFDIGFGTTQFRDLLIDARASRSDIFSFRLKGPEVGGVGSNYWAFNSSDNATAGNRPLLTIAYTLPATGSSQAFII